MTVLYPTSHAVEALAIYYPAVSGKDLIAELELGVQIERATALGLAGRRGEKVEGSEDRYILHRERTGIFVLSGVRVVTFLRFYSIEQHRTAARLWPGGDAPSCTARWARDLERDLELETLPSTSPTFFGVQRPVVSQGAKTATGMSGERVQAVVCREIRDGLIVPGEVRLSGVRLAVNRKESGNGLRVGLAEGEDERLRTELTREVRSQRKEGRRQRGLEQAADLLRRHGWTCTPPVSDEGT